MKQASTVAPVADTLIKLRVEITSAGIATAQTVTMANGQTFVPRERWPLHVQRAIDDARRTGW